ncbi:hypothetical protein FOZ62_007925, partial [Perkinsus olseni]
MSRGGVTVVDELVVNTTLPVETGVLLIVVGVAEPVTEVNTFVVGEGEVLALDVSIKLSVLLAADVLFSNRVVDTAVGDGDELADRTVVDDAVLVVTTVVDGTAVITVVDGAVIVVTNAVDGALPVVLTVVDCTAVVDDASPVVTAVVDGTAVVAAVVDDASPVVTTVVDGTEGVAAVVDDASPVVTTVVDGTEVVAAVVDDASPVVTTVVDGTA